MSPKKICRFYLNTGILFVFIVLPFCVFAEEEIPVIETETGIYYVVQKGDTLWDLSKRFNDSPWLWPDLWSQNEQITNPHLIYPGQKIRLFRRTDVEKAKKEVPPESAEEAGEELDLTEKAPRYYVYSPIESIGFIREEPVEPLGSILKVADEKEMISTGDTVFIKHPDMTSVSLGQKYVTYETISPVVHPVSGKNLGTQHLLTGVVEITRTEPKFSVATVVKAYRTIRVGHLLMPYEPRSHRIPIVESQEGLYGNIVASEKLTKLFGDDTVVFIDKGEMDGAKPGQFYQVYKQDKVLYDEKTRERVLLTPIVLGSILVLHTERSTSTVLVDKSGGIPIGAIFGEPVP